MKLYKYSMCVKDNNLIKTKDEIECEQVEGWMGEIISIIDGDGSVNDIICRVNELDKVQPRYKDCSYFVYTLNSTDEWFNKIKHIVCDEINESINEHNKIINRLEQKLKLYSE